MRRFAACWILGALSIAVLINCVDPYGRYEQYDVVLDDAGLDLDVFIQEDAPPDADAAADAPLADAPLADTPLADARPGDAPPGDAPPGDAPPGDAPPGDAPPGDAPPGDAPLDDAPPPDADAGADAGLDDSGVDPPLDGPDQPPADGADPLDDAGPRPDAGGTPPGFDDGDFETTSFYACGSTGGGMLGGLPLLAAVAFAISRHRRRYRVPLAAR